MGDRLMRDASIANRICFNLLQIGIASHEKILTNCKLFTNYTLG